MACYSEWLRQADEAVRWWAAVADYQWLNASHYFDGRAWDWLSPIVGRDRYWSGWEPPHIPPPLIGVKGPND